MNRQKTILAILLVLFALSLAYSYLRQPRQKAVGKLKYMPGMVASSPRPAGKTLDEKKLHLELLESGGGRFTGVRRNIFRSVFADEGGTRHPAVRPILPIPPPPAASLPLPSPPPPPLTPGEQAMKDVAQFKFLGFLQKDNRKTIFLSKDNVIILVKQGDRIAGKYEVANISNEALTINLLNGSGHIVIPLVENRALGGNR